MEMTTEERLENLERELASANRRNRWLLAVVGLAVIGLVLASTWTKTTAIAQAQGAGAVPKVVRANEFILEEENGKTRATLKVDKDGPKLALFDENGMSSASLGVGKDAALLRLYGENGKSCVILCVLKDAPILALQDENGKDRAMLSVNKDEGTGLHLFDKKGQGRVTLGACKVASPDGAQTQYPESSLCLFGPDGKSLWSAP